MQHVRFLGLVIEGGACLVIGSDLSPVTCMERVIEDLRGRGD